MDSRIAPSAIFGERSSLSSSRLGMTHTLVPSRNTSMMRSVRFARKTQIEPSNDEVVGSLERVCASPSYPKAIRVATRTRSSSPAT